MTSRQVTQYICDHCGKRALSKGAMTLHEQRCTMNPNRHCRMCSLLDVDQEPMAELVACLPVAPATGEWPEEYEERCRAALPTLREKAHDCPVCIFAAIRQAKIPAEVTGFDFAVESTAAFEKVNARHSGREGYL